MRSISYGPDDTYFIAYHPDGRQVNIRDGIDMHQWRAENEYIH